MGKGLLLVLRDGVSLTKTDYMAVYTQIFTNLRPFSNLVAVLVSAAVTHRHTALRFLVLLRWN